MNRTRLKEQLSKLIKLFRNIVIICIVTGLFFISLYIIWQEIFQPVSQEIHLKEIVINHGARARDIATKLENRGIIRSKSVFLFLAKIERKSRSLKAGKYALSPHMNYFEILDKLEKGKVILRKFTVPEGMTIRRIAELWEKNNFGEKEDFIQAASRTELLNKLGINPESLGISNLEGYLFPETYRFADGTNANRVVSMMFKEFCKRFKKLEVDEQKVKMSIHEIVILASIIESEAHVDEERPIISAVYHNRLKHNRKLESDPTVLYALGKYKKRLLYSELKVDSPYNTYKYKGLPPGPICNPGIASIFSAAYPAENDYMYFVAKGDGTHYFSQTFREHRKAKNRFY